MNLKHTLTIGLVLILFATGYQFKTSHATVLGHWRSLNSESNVIFFNDGSMKFKGMPANYQWIGKDNMRIEISGIGGSIIKWFGGDIVVQVKLEHDFVSSPSWRIRDTLIIKKTDGKKTKYLRVS